VKKVILTVETDRGEHVFSATDKRGDTMTALLVLGVFGSALRMFGHEVQQVFEAFKVISDALHAAAPLADPPAMTASAIEERDKMIAEALANMEALAKTEASKAWIGGTKGETQPTPDYVFAILEAWKGQQPLDFGGAYVPKDVREWITKSFQVTPKKKGGEGI